MTFLNSLINNLKEESWSYKLLDETNKMASKIKKKIIVG